MFKNPLRKLENSRIPLLGPNVKALRFWGLLLPKQKAKRYFYLLMHILVSIFTFTEWVDIWYIKSDLNLLMNNVKITMLATMSMIKVTTFLYWQDHWINIIEYVTSTDFKQRISKDSIKTTIISKYTKYCRRITYLYWSLMYTTVIIVMFTPVFKYFLSKSYRENASAGIIAYHQVVSSWVPFDKSTLLGHVGASVIQSYASVYGGGWITSFDTNAMVIMVFFRGQLELLKRDSARIFQAGTTKGTAAAMERLKDCQRRHSDLVRFARLFNACLSPIMFFYMFVCSVMLCVTAYQITMETSAMERFLTTEYLVFGIAQLFMYCWHSNAVLYASNNLMIGPYESEWWHAGAEIRKDLYILVEQYKKTVVFTAGPFTALNVSTFISILKGAYSYYTLLTQSQIK